MKCHGCGDTGHIERNCPNAAIDARPPWCGSCDERTRHVDLGDTMLRCRDCHPLRGRMLAQDRRCPGCHAIVYVWDHAACGRHQPVGVQFTRVVPGEREDLRPALRAACPWCKAGPGSRCVNVGTQAVCAPHAARLAAAGLEAGPADASRRLALVQVAEARAAHGPDLDAWLSSGG